MAERREPLAAWLAAAFIGLALAAGFLPVLLAGAPDAAVFDAYLWRVLRFTLLQALLSMAMSLALAIPVALAVSRHAFCGKAMVLRLLALPLALPPIVAILGLVEVFGEAGWFGGLVPIYGLAGILIAHVFFNMPLAARFFIERLESVPPETHRLAQALGFNSAARFRRIEWPLLRAAMPGVAALIFLLCAASFAVVLTLGGGPQATTLEVAIYQSLRFDYDPARSAALAIVQIALCAALVFILSRHSTVVDVWPRLRRHQVAEARDGKPTALIVIGPAVLYIALPLIALVAAGLTAPWPAAALIPALVTSVMISLAAAALAMMLAYALAWGAARSRFAAAFGLGSLATLILPPAVLATGWFILAVRLGAQSRAGAALVILLTALMALPFALSALAPAFRDCARRNDPLCAALGLTGFRRFRLIEVHELKRPLLLAFAMCLVVSLGDLTAITLFGSESLVTLPSLIHSQMGSYRLSDASATALVLMILSFGLIAAADRQARS